MPIKEIINIIEKTLWCLLLIIALYFSIDTLIHYFSPKESYITDRFNQRKLIQINLTMDMIKAKIGIIIMFGLLALSFSKFRALWK